MINVQRGTERGARAKRQAPLFPGERLEDGEPPVS